MVIRLGWAAARVRAAACAADRSSALACGRKTSPASVSRAALGGAVQQPGAQLLFQLPDLPAQGRLGHAESFRGAAAVKVAASFGIPGTDPVIPADGANVIVHLSPAPVVALTASRQAGRATWPPATGAYLAVTILLPRRRVCI